MNCESSSWSFVSMGFKTVFQLCLALSSQITGFSPGLTSAARCSLSVKIKNTPLIVDNFHSSCTQDASEDILSQHLSFSAAIRPPQKKLQRSDPFI
jgi:hypothetical protein